MERLIRFDSHITTSKQSFTEDRAKEFTKDSMDLITEKLEEYYQEEHEQVDYDLDEDDTTRYVIDRFYNNALEAYGNIYDIVKNTLDKDLNNKILKLIENELEKDILVLKILDSADKSIKIIVNDVYGTDEEIDKMIYNIVEEAFTDYECNEYIIREVPKKLKLNFVQYASVIIDTDLYLDYILADLNIKNKIYVEPITK